jgi:hypothetical protein
MHWMGTAFFPVGANSGLSSSTQKRDSRSQILMVDAVAAHSQYRMGEKHRAWMVSPASRLDRWRPSLRSHVAGVADQVGAQLAVVQVPHLHELVPAGRNNEGGVKVGRETHARDPLLFNETLTQATHIEPRAVSNTT